MFSAANRIFIMLDDDKGVAVLFQLGECSQQDAVVTRVQTDGGFVQHIADALHVRAKLCGKSDALRFST